MGMAEIFAVGTARAQPGTMATGYIESAYMQDGSRVRIPLIVVSKYSTGGNIVHSYNDHASIVKFI